MVRKPLRINKIASRRNPSHIIGIALLRTHNPLVLGSNPSGPTTLFHSLILQSGFRLGLQFADAAENLGADGIPRLAQALCAKDTGDLPQGGHVFSCACHGGGRRSGGVGGERSFGVGPAA